jgi:3-oxoadipate enol-lactonase
METIIATGTDLNIVFDSQTTCYDDLGTGGTPLIFVHGFPFDKSMWQPQMDCLGKYYRVIAYDIRGFGKSTARNEKASISLFAEDLIKFMDALEINKAVVCGLSMGGYILLNAVSRFPERFDAIILCSTQCIVDTPQILENRKNTIEHINSFGLANFANSTVENVFCQNTLVTRRDFVENIRNLILSTSPLAITQTLGSLAQRGEIFSTLGKILLPSLILCGIEDMVISPLQSEFLHNNIAASQFHIISNAGHMINLEQPDSFNQYIVNFISSFAK